MQKAIGIFDSGIGGLTVLKEIVATLPDENIIYLGDTARVPYGIRSAETVTRYSFENTQFLLSQEIKLLVVACNTASAISLEAVKKEYPLPVKSWAMPPASWPTASIFCDWRNCSSSCFWTRAFSSSSRWIRSSIC